MFRLFPGYLGEQCADYFLTRNKKIICYMLCRFS